MSAQAKGRHDEAQWVNSIDSIGPIDSILNHSKEAHEYDDVAVPNWAIWLLLALVALVVLLLAGTAWGYLLRFYPSTACMVQMLFATACK